MLKALDQNEGGNSKQHDDAGDARALVTAALAAKTIGAALLTSRNWNNRDRNASARVVVHDSVGAVDDAGLVTGALYSANSAGASGGVVNSMGSSMSRGLRAAQVRNIVRHEAVA